jgi:hypothetical protein
MARPFQSKFIPYVNQIKAWRRAGKTWQEVAKELTALGVKADAGNVCRVMGRIKRRPYPLGAEPEPEHADAAPAQPAKELETHAKKEEPARHSLLTKKKPNPLKIQTIQHE